MSSTKSQVAVATSIPSLSSSQSQKEYSTEEPLGRQNSFGNNRRGNMKGKHLTRSHAMRESTSPPRTPTPRAEHGQVSPNGQASSNYQQQHHHQQQQQHVDGNEIASSNNNNNNNNNNNHNKLHAQSTATRGNSPIIETPAVIVTSQQSQPQQQQQQPNVALCNEVEFPKLTPPKSTKGGGGGGSGGGNSSGGGQRNNNNSSNSNSTNGIADGNSKMDYSSSNNNAGKRLSGDMKANTSGGGGAYEPSKSTGANANSNNNNNNSKQQQQQYNASNALHQALNVPDGAPVRGQQQQTMTVSASTAANVHNSGMNYQLNATDVSHQHQQQQQHHQLSYDKENRCPRNDSQNSNMSNMHDDEQQHQQQQHQHYERSGGGGGGGGGKKHRTNSNSKGTKPRLKNMGSSSGSVDGNSNSNNTSGFISRVFNNSENSGDQFTDHGGTDLLSFFKETLNKHPKDRHFLLKVEKDLIDFVQDKNRGEMRFPSASSYNRMLIHRTAAFFGMEHNVDTETQQCVIVAATKNTRIPEIRFKSLVRDHRDDSRKSILKRDTHSFDEARQSSYLCPDRGSMLDRKAKSFEEREEDYERARSRIFNRSQNDSGEAMEESYMNVSWPNAMEQQQQQQQQQQSNRNRPNGKMMKMQNSTESRDSRAGGGAVPKAHSFGNYGGPPSSGGPPLLRGDSANSNKNSGGRVFSKQDSAGSTNTPWRLSPSSSGYKTQTQSVQSDSVTPSPNGYGSEEHTPEPSVIACQSPPQPQLQLSLPTATATAAAATTAPDAAAAEHTALSPAGLVWAVTEISNVPKGSVLINPQTLQPIVNQDGSIYHFDPSNLPPSQAMTTGGAYHSPSNTANATNYAPPLQPPQQQQQQQAPPPPQPQTNAKKNKSHQVPPAQHTNQPKHSPTEASTSSVPNHADTMSESSTQTVALCTDAACESNLKANNLSDANSTEEASTQISADECDNSATSCLSITTTTSTKNFDRIEVQKYKHQATSPNIPTEKEEVPKRENSASSDGSNTRDQPPSRNQPPPSQTPTSAAPLQRETPHSARSTPYSNSETNTKRASEEPKPSTWTYTQSYQAPDGSTVFHTTNTPSGTPYCTTTYQQGLDGSIYAIPQNMVYAYTPQDGEVQSYFMPVFDPSQQRSDATGLIPAGAPALYPTTGGTATMVPVATAYPTAQFAATNMAPVYPGPMIYSTEQFTPGGAAVAAAAAAPANGQLQQIPMTTYPMGYPYPYNGIYHMTYYMPQQTLANAVTATPLLPPPSATASAVAGPHVTGGVNLTNGLITATAAAGPPSTATAALGSGSSSGCGGGNHHVPCSVTSTSSSYQTHSGTTYFGTGRIKRHTPAHYASHPSGHQLMATIPSSGSATTTYHAVPTLTLAAPANAAAAAAPTDLSAPSAAAPAATMYTLPQHAAIFPANIFPYPATAAASAPGVTAGAPQAHTQGGALAPPVAAHPAVGAAHAQQSNAVITPLYAHHPPMHTHGAAMHTPGPAAIPIVDPTTLATISQAPNGAANGPVSYGGGGGGMGGCSNTSQSAPSTPHSLPSQAPQRNPPLFSTPPIMNTSAGGGSSNYSSSSTPHYYTGGEQQSGGAPLINSPHNSYVPHEKRNNNNSSNAGGKKPPTYNNGSIGRQNSTSSAYNGSVGKQPLLGANNDSRSSPSNGYQGSRPHAMNKRGGDKPQAPLLSGPPSYSGANSTASNYHQHHSCGSADSKPPMRLNAAAASFRQKGSGDIEFRRSVSQRNSPSTNSSSNDNSNNTSPNSIAGSNGPTQVAAINCYTATGGYMSSSHHNHPGGGDHQQHSAATAATPLYITARGTHIPPQLQHGGVVATAAAAAGGAAGMGSQQATTAAVLGGAAAAAAAAEVANAAAAAAAASVAHHQPLLGAYNPGASGVYIKYGQTYFAHPSVALPNSRRSPSTDLRPAMAQVAGMYPTVNMMIPAPPRHAQGRHPNPNYKGTRPR